MSVQHAGLTIQEARLKAGLTQEQLSEGICSPVSLSRIESGSAGVSPITFQALMSKAGAPCEAFPVFASRADFDCFYTLKRAKFYIDTWNLSKGYHELDKVETANFADNKFYYQEWLLLHSRLQFRSGCGNHQHIFETLSAALTISKPEIDFFDFRNLLFSTTEIELLIALAQEALYLNKLPMCLEICTQISAYLENSAFPFLERDNLLAANAIVYAKYLIAVKDYSMALEVADEHYNKMAQNTSYIYLHELAFLTGLSHHYCQNSQSALKLFQTAFFSAHSINSVYATILHKHLTDYLNISLISHNDKIILLPVEHYIEKSFSSTLLFSSGIYDCNSTNSLTLGKLIKELRTEQKLSQQALCQGLCSKSMLSKIENDFLSPDIILTENLLQRLGICTTIFTYFGSAHDTRLNELMRKILLTPFRNIDANNHYLNEMAQMLTPDDFLYEQFILYRKSFFVQNFAVQKKYLEKALQITRPNLNIANITPSSYSELELHILFELANLYSQNNEYFIASNIYYRLLEIIENNTNDILLQKRLYPLLLSMIALHFYHNHAYSDLKKLYPPKMLCASNGSLYYKGHFFAHYSQGLLELNGDSPEFRLYAKYAYYNFKITKRNQSCSIFKNAVPNFF